MDKIKAATSDISVQLVFNNAGFITTGGRDDRCGLGGDGPLWLS
jgi:hypothetical protein